MADQLNVEHFAPLVGQSFAVVAPALDDLALRLTVAETYGAAQAVGESGDRSAFRLVFRGPQTGILPQGTYRLEHDALQLDIFLVPLQPDAEGPVYEAVFS